MTRLILLLSVCLLSCGQQMTKQKQQQAAEPSIDSSSYVFTGTKAALDDMFQSNRDSVEFRAEDRWTSLFVGHLFSKEDKDAVLRYKDNDTVANVIVLRQKGEHWDTIFSARYYPHTGAMSADFIQVEDFNGDNIPDLKVVKNYWDFHTGESSDLWLYGKEHFTKVVGFDSIVSAAYDKRTNLIYSYQSMGCADMVMYFGIFRIIGNKVEKVKEMSCDCCTELMDSCSIKVFGQASYKVPYKTAYKHVPGFYAEGVKVKCGL